MLTRYFKRPIAALLSIWFVLAMAAPEALHSCPVHASASGEHSSHAMQHEHATHGSSSSDDTSHAICSCPGDCASGAFGVVLPVTPSQPVALVSSHQPLFGLHVSELATRVDLLLPLAIGPPPLSVS
ncbi:MAG TPA: hypothetical protein VF042_13085 [Gemmatimonadaceae bacterium]